MAASSAHTIRSKTAFGIGTATDLRHTAAQRLVDAGASHEELAEFLGHAQTNTGLVYYATSASHAERINPALGASDVYRRVAMGGFKKWAQFYEQYRDARDRLADLGAMPDAAILEFGGNES